MTIADPLMSRITEEDIGFDYMRTADSKLLDFRTNPPLSVGSPFEL
jgi:hypothetical protein